MKLRSAIRTFFVFILLSNAACSSRVDSPTTAADSTIIYPSKKGNDNGVKITFYRKESKKSGKLIGEGKRFAIKQNRNLRVLVELNNSEKQELLLHLVWIAPDQKVILRKQYHLLPGDTNILKSNISLSPQKRKAGKYRLRVYLFRELIAEKEFELLPKFWLTKAEAEKVTTGITFYRKMSKKNAGKRIGENTVFILVKKRVLRADVNVQRPFNFSSHELKFKLNWTGPDGKTFYKKQIILAAGDTTSVLHSSISISPEKRKTGGYQLKVFLFDEKIGEKAFRLVSSTGKH